MRVSKVLYAYWGFSILFDIYLLTSWIIVYNRFSTQSKRLTHYLEFWPFLNSLDYLQIALPLFNIISLILIVINIEKMKKTIALSGIIFFLLFFLFWVWSNL